MTVAVTYPGVYIQEIPSGVRTIATVATSITAFVGRAPLGEVEMPTDCFSFGEFVRRFGGLSVDYPQSYAVRDFFANGGSRAVIVRLFRPDADDGRARLTVGGNLNLVAATPGGWGDAIRATVKYAPRTPADDEALTAIAGPLGLVLGDFFATISQPVLTNLKLSLPNIGVTERFPVTLGDLYHGQQLTIAAKYSKTASGPVKLTAMRNGQQVEYSWPSVEFANTSTAEYVPSIWAGRKIAWMVDQIRLHGVLPLGS